MDVFIKLLVTEVRYKISSSGSMVSGPNMMNRVRGLTSMFGIFLQELD